VPSDRNLGICTMLVVVTVAFVFVEYELARSACIDAKFDRVWLCGSRFGVGTEGNDRASPRIDWNPVKWGFSIDGLTATHSFASPEIDPILASRKVKRSLLRSVFFYRVDQKSFPEHKLIRNLTR